MAVGESAYREGCFFFLCTFAFYWLRFHHARRKYSHHPDHFVYLSIVDFSSSCANTQMKFNLCNGNLWPGYFFFCCEHSSIDNICFHLIYAFLHIDNSNEYISIRFGFLLNLTDRNTKHTKCSINSCNLMWQSSCRIKSQRIQFPKCMIGGMDSCEIRKMKVKQAIAMEWIRSDMNCVRLDQIGLNTRDCVFWG